MTSDLGRFNRQHGDLLQVNTRRGKKIPIPCPHCRKPTTERYWHTRLGKGVCDSCWRQLEHTRIPAVL